MRLSIVDLILEDRRDRSRLIALVLLLAFASLVVVLVARTGCSFQTDMAWDSVIMLEAGTRWLQGQVPHLDYISPIGVLPTWLMSLALRLSQGTAHALAYAPLLILFPVTLAGWWVACRRLSAWLALGFGLFLVTLVTATRPLPFGMVTYPFEFMHASYAMAYNRLGWALLMVLTLQQFLPARGPMTSFTRRAEAAMAGCLCVLLLLTKVNYAAAGAGMVLVAVVVRSQMRRELPALLLGSAVTVALATAFLRFNPAAWWREFAYLGKVNPLVSRLERFGELTLGNLLPLLVTVGSLILVWPLLRDRPDQGSRMSAQRTLLLVVAAIGCGLWVLTFNAQRSEVPLLALATLILAELASRRLCPRDRVEHAARLRQRTVAGVSAFLAIGTFGADLASLVWSAAYSRHMRACIPAGQTLASPMLAPLLLPPLRHEEANPERAIGRISRIGGPTTPYHYAMIINDGIRLAGSHVDAQSRILTFDLVNPFPFALQHSYPRGGALWWAWNTFSRSRYADADFVLRDATHLMIAKAPIQDTDEVSALQGFYRTEIERDFTVAAESTFWLLLRRR